MSLSHTGVRYTCTISGHRYTVHTPKVSKWVKNGISRILGSVLSPTFEWNMPFWRKVTKTALFAKTDRFGSNLRLAEVTLFGKRVKKGQK